MIFILMELITKVIPPPLIFSKNAECQWAYCSPTNPTSHIGNIRLLRPVVVAVEYWEDRQAENDDHKGAKNRRTSGCSDRGTAIPYCIPEQPYLPLQVCHGYCGNFL